MDVCLMEGVEVTEFGDDYRPVAKKVGEGKRSSWTGTRKPESLALQRVEGGTRK